MPSTGRKIETSFIRSKPKDGHCVTFEFSWTTNLDRSSYMISRIVLVRLSMFWIAVLSFVSTSGCAQSVKPLKLSSNKQVKVAFVIDEGATMIDFAGPWEVFQDVMILPDG